MKDTEGIRQKINNFNQEDFTKWIWQRTHGIDNMTSITTIRDPNPHHALLDWYKVIEDKTKFVSGLIDSLSKAIKMSQTGNNDELLALERHLHIMSRIKEQDMPLQARNLFDQCYNFVFRTNCPKPESLQRITLSLATKFGNSVTDKDLVQALTKKELTRVAFKALTMRHGAQAISDYFQYVNNTTCLLTKITVECLVKEFGKKIVEEQLQKIKC